MNNKVLKKILIGISCTIGVIYLLFLILPFILAPIFDNLSSKVTTEIQKATGFKTEFKKFRIVTTPKLTVGAKLENLKVFEPNGNLLLEGDNFVAKMSLLPLFARKIEADLIGADKLNLNLTVKKDGHFAIEDSFVQTETPNNENSNNEEQFALPFGLKLSNHLPDFRLQNHNITFIDAVTGKKYSLTGSDTAITDFIINKKIKVKSKGKLTLDGFETFSYDVKILNKLMPDMELNDLITAPVDEAETQPVNTIDFNIINAFNVLKNNQIKGSLAADLKIGGNFENPELNGNVTLDKISMLIKGRKLPESNVKIDFSGNKYLLDSNIYTNNNENTKATGTIVSGNKPKIDLTVKSNSTLKSLFEIANNIAQIFGVNDLKTLSAEGLLDVDFNIKSDLKKINSNGKIKLTNGAIAYGLYDVKINDLVSDIKLDNNSILINKLGFSTLSIPLNVTGKITPDAKADIKVTTNNLPLKGLLVSLGQASLLKENPIYSGSVSVSANITDELTAPKIKGHISVDNLKLKNIPSDVTVAVNPVVIDLKTTKTGYEGTINASKISLVNPAITVLSDVITGNIDENIITFKDSFVKASKNDVTVKGVISDYMKDKIALDFDTKGAIKSKLKGNLNPYKMTLNLNFALLPDSTIVIPGFDKSKLKAQGTVDITGAMDNPTLKGQFEVPYVDIPEVPVQIKDLTAKLDGKILNGNATLANFVSGGIKAENLKSDFKLDGNNFYLNNLKGTAFDGTIDGNILYNIATTYVAVKLNGKNMNSLKAIEGAAGIKNALSGSLDFSADVNLKGVEYEDMMKNLKGSADFQIKKGYLANLGGLKTLLNAQNILSNTVLKAASTKVSGLPIVQQASEFDYINGKMTFQNAYANLDSIKIAGPLMAYFVTGKFQLLNGSVNATVLGRFDEAVTGKLGNIGEVAVSKITNFIPSLGTLTAVVAKAMNESPKSLDLSSIPSLTSSNKECRDFKAVFNGGIDAGTAVKTFKWLNDVDTSALDGAQAQLNEINNTINQTKTNVQNTVTSVKTQAVQAKEDAKQYAKDQAKDLFKSFMASPVKSAQ